MRFETYLCEHIIGIGVFRVVITNSSCWNFLFVDIGASVEGLAGDTLVGCDLEFHGAHVVVKHHHYISDWLVCCNKVVFVFVS